MISDANFITASFADSSADKVCPTVFKNFNIKEGLKKAEIEITAHGVYEAFANGKRIGNFILAPGWTNYEKRLQYQRYDITDLLKTGENTIEVTVGNGWYRGSIGRERNKLIETTPNVIASIALDYGDKTEEIITDNTWQSKESRVMFSDIYDGEIFDANHSSEISGVNVVLANKEVLICQEGEIVCEHETLLPAKCFTTPGGETVYDFGQEITGYVEVCTDAKKGDVISLSFAEVLDKDGNFYNENYRDAKCIYKYICKDGKQSYKPHTTFYGFRYIRVDSAPENTSFKAIVLHSDIKRTGYLKTKSEKLNRLFDNIIWGQKDNFLDVPTDCPQRDERLGWTGDAEVFSRAAMYQFDTEKFYKKWLNDMKTEQGINGYIPNVVPNVIFPSKVNYSFASPAYGDAAVIIPWNLYEMYGDKKILETYFDMMTGWVSYMEKYTLDKGLWTGHEGYGDWLGLDAHPGSYKGASRDDFISSAYFKYSASIVAKAAKIIGLDPKPYEKLAEKIRENFIARFPECTTQTEYVLAIHFDLTDKKEEYAKALADMIRANSTSLTTGFVGTPYVLFVLSKYGYTDIAYDLLLREEFPSWLFSVNKGATTIWEHWDGIREDGTFWSKDMNSFNHYAYGSVAEWVFSVAAGIKIGAEGIEIAPHPDKRLGFLDAKFDSHFGTVRVKWEYEGDTPKIDISVPCECTLNYKNSIQKLKKGSNLVF